MYKITYDIANGFIFSSEEVTTESAMINDSAVHERLLSGSYARFVDGEVVFDESTPSVQENVVPEGETVGIPKEEYERLYPTE